MKMMSFHSAFLVRGRLQKSIVDCLKSCFDSTQYFKLLRIFKSLHETGKPIRMPAIDEIRTHKISIVSH